MVEILRPWAIEVRDECEHALRGSFDCDLFLACDLESLRVCGGGGENRFGANGVPVPFQTGKAGAFEVAMRQNSARRCSASNEK